MNKTIMWQEILQQKEVIDKCLKYNLPTIDKIKEDISKKSINSIILSARGTSDHVAMFAKYLFEIYYNIPVCLASPSIFTMYNSNINMKNSLVIGISQSGAAEDVAAVLSAANDQNAITIGVTNTIDSLIANKSKYHLYCNAGKENSVAATKTFITQLYLTTLLASHMTNDQHIKNSLDQVDDAIKQAIDLYEQIKLQVLQFKYMQECFVLARGLTLPIAMEAALKIQETSYVRAKAYPISDFHHGPFAMVNKEIPVILISTDNLVEKDTIEIITKLKDQQVSIISITNNSKIACMTDSNILLPTNLLNISAAFCASVIAQIFACELSLIKNNNPDSPRGLKKVTITK